jgi:hypothetical protein
VILRDIAPEQKWAPEHWLTGDVVKGYADITHHYVRGDTMGRGILLWLLGVPIPVIILLALIWH